MIEFNLEEYNRLCAEFLGYEIFENEECFKTPNKNGWVNLNIFYTDWNWIMEIVGKIETLFDGFVLFNIEDENCFVAVTGVRNYHNYTTMASKKEAAVHAIWHFLNWYKENKS
jgi:hypothetical protein